MALTRSKIDYTRPVLLFDQLIDNLTIAEVEQDDERLQVATKLSYSKRILLDLSYSFQRNDSNSFGYSYSRHQLILVLGLPLGKQMWLRGYGATQIKNYTEQSLPIFPTDVDTERDESNFFILDLSKDLKPELSVNLRFAYYSNESAIRSQFYSKSLIGAGFDFRF